MGENSLVFHGRVVAIGDACVGKTSILNRLMDQNFDEFEQSTVGANWQLFVREINGDRIELQIWDTAGQEKFRSLGPLYYRNAVGAIIVYDVTNRESFESLDEWINSFTNVAGTDGTIMILANKCDLENRVVSQKEGLDWAKSHNFAHYDTSAKTGQNIDRVFDVFAEEIIANKSAKNNQKMDGLEAGTGKGCC